MTFHNVHMPDDESLHSFQLGSGFTVTIKLM